MSDESAERSTIGLISLRRSFEWPLVLSDGIPRKSSFGLQSTGDNTSQPPGQMWNAAAEIGTDLLDFQRAKSPQVNLGETLNINAALWTVGIECCNPHRLDFITESRQRKKEASPCVFFVLFGENVASINKFDSHFGVP